MVVFPTSTGTRADPEAELFRALSIWLNWVGAASFSFYIESKNYRSLWYQIDKGDADMATFFHYLGQAVKSASRSRKKMPTLTPEY